MRLVTTLKKLIAPRARPSADDARQREQYWERLEPLGELRCRVLACMNADTGWNYFNPPESADLNDELLRFLEGKWEQWLHEARGPQFNATAVVAAGLLTFGRLEMADYIVANLPPERIKLDHGCGWCNAVAPRIAASLLPLPDRLRAYMEWYEGSALADEVRSWLAANRSRLRWDATRQKCDLAAVPEGSA